MQYKSNDKPWYCVQTRTVLWPSVMKVNPLIKFVQHPEKWINVFSSPLGVCKIVLCTVFACVYTWASFQFFRWSTKGRVTLILFQLHHSQFSSRFKENQWVLLQNMLGSSRDLVSQSLEGEGMSSSCWWKGIRLSATQQDIAYLNSWSPQQVCYTCRTDIIRLFCQN